VVEWIDLLLLNSSQLVRPAIAENGSFMPVTIMILPASHHYVPYLPAATQVHPTQDLYHRGTSKQPIILLSHWQGRRQHTIATGTATAGALLVARQERG
jgi:hypothetical protein